MRFLLLFVLLFSFMYSKEYSLSLNELLNLSKKNSDLILEKKTSFDFENIFSKLNFFAKNQDINSDFNYKNINTIEFEVKKNYYTYIFTNNVRDILKSNLKQLKLAYKFVKILLNESTDLSITKSDRLKIEIAINLLKSLINKIELNNKLAKISLLEYARLNYDDTLILKKEKIDIKLKYKNLDEILKKTKLKSKQFEIKKNLLKHKSLFYDYTLSKESKNKADEDSQTNFLAYEFDMIDKKQLVQSYMLKLIFELNYEKSKYDYLLNTSFLDSLIKGQKDEKK